MPQSFKTGMKEGLDAYRDGYNTIALRIIGALAENKTLDARYRAKARYWLGVIHDFGVGDKKAAAADYAVAAELGHVMAQLRLSEAYYSAVGVPLDYVRAYMWAIIAATHVHNEYEYDIATGARDDLTEVMSQPDVARAKQMAHEWLARHGKRAGNQSLPPH